MRIRCKRIYSAIPLMGAFLFPVLGTVHAANADAPQAVYYTREGAKDAASLVYQYHPNSTYSVNTKMGFVTDIELHPGDTISYIAGGDTARWAIDTSTVSGTAHIYVKPLAKNIHTNLIVNTNRYSYRIGIYSTDTPTTLVRWEYPDEIREAMKREMARPVYKDKKEKTYLDTHTEAVNGMPVQKHLNYGYELKNHGVAQATMPTEVFDDGTRTYIKIPAQNKYDFPTLYHVNDQNKLTLVNYRVVGSYLVADRVFSKARLTYTSKSYVEIRSSTKTTLHDTETPMLSVKEVK